VVTEKKSKENIKIIYILLGVTALVIAIFDLQVKNYFDVALSISWGALFIFIGIRGLLDSKLNTKSVKIIHFIILLMIILSSFYKLFYRLKHLTP
jgi:heme O synthase-like polyprenyltransferase